MFQYWLLNSDSFSLLGDADGNGQLEGDERYFRSMTSQILLQRIRRIDVTVVAESDAFDPFMPGQHRQVTLSSTVGLRNVE
jgi:hypothetical protein